MSVARLTSKISHISKVIKSGSDDDHEFVIRLADKRSGLIAFVAVHSTSRGPAHGGTRMKQYDSEAEACTDALHLSQAMTFKNALAGLPYGGAKGVIMFDPTTMERNRILRAYAEKVQALNGLFRTGTDVGLQDDDTAFMSKYCDYILGMPKQGLEKHTTSDAAARGVFYAIQAAVFARFGRRSLAGTIVGIKGVGKLGGYLAGLLSEADAKIMVADNDDRRLRELRRSYPSLEVVPSDVIHTLPMHVYAPCALGAEFSRTSIRDLRCDLIVGGANNQLTDPQVADDLHKRGILYIPDYVANAGGLIFVCEDLEAGGYDEARVERRLRDIKKTVAMLIERSEEAGIAPLRIADMIALERLGGSAQ